MNLLLFLSFQGSLAKWQREGILTREMALYQEHLRRSHVDEVVIYTYGRDDEKALDALGMDDMTRGRFVLASPRLRLGGKLGAILHSLDLGILWRLRRRANIAKTNQISGCWPAIILRLMGVPLFARCGYILSRRLIRNGNKAAYYVALVLEFLLFNAARIVSVTTAEAKASVERMLIRRRSRVFVSPTYVDTDIFQADAALKQDDGLVIYVGRLEPQKNVLAIVEACALAGMKLAIIGDGSQREEVKQKIAALNVNAAMIPRLENSAIAQLYRKHRYFILGSLHEGLPKVLIEAMAAEMTCIGTPISGITDLISDGETGFLATGTDAQALADAMIRARSDDGKSIAVAQAARRAVLERHSIATYVLRERDEIERALGHR